MGVGWVGNNNGRKRKDQVDWKSGLEYGGLGQSSWAEAIHVYSDVRF